MAVGGWQTINQGSVGISGVLGQTQPLLTGHALHHIRIGPPGPVSTYLPEYDPMPFVLGLWSEMAACLKGI